MNTIEIGNAQKEFSADVRVGEFVAWWVSDDRQSSMNATTSSYATEEAAEAAAAEMLDDESLRDADGRTLRETGSLEINLVVADA